MLSEGEAPAMMRGFSALDRPFEDVTDYARQPARRQYTPEQRIALAQLEHSVDTIRKYRSSPAGAHLVAYELAWVADENESDDGYLTFIWCCELAGLDPEAVRAGIANDQPWRRKYRQGRVT